jgi:hypothetical protein
LFTVSSMGVVRRFGEDFLSSAVRQPGKTLSTQHQYPALATGPPMLPGLTFANRIEMGAPRDHAVSPWQLTAPDVVFLPGHIPLFAAGPQLTLAHTKCVLFSARAYWLSVPYAWRE